MTSKPDAEMNAVMHSAFKREILRLRDAVTRADLNEQTTRDGIVARYRFFAVTLRDHHVGEDTYLWPDVLGRVTPAEAVIIRAMEDEHEALASALEALDQEFDTFSEASDPRVIADKFDTLHLVLTGHCQHEERDGVPIVLKYLSDESAKGFEKYNRQRDNTAMTLAWICDGATPHEQQTTWGVVPGPVRMIMKPLGDRRYRKFSAACGV